MPSDLYRAIVHDEDIDYIRALIETTPSKEHLNQLEPNGTTPLHEACRRQNEVVVLLLLHEFHVQYHWQDQNGQTAYDIANERIRSLFPPEKRDGNAFCTKSDAVNPFVVLGSDNIDHANHWLRTIPHESDISVEHVMDAAQSHGDAWRSLFSWIGSVLRPGHTQEKFDQWVAITGSYIAQSMRGDELKRAMDLLQKYRRTENIQYLLTLYSLQQSFTQYIGKDLERTQHFYAPIKKFSYELENRSYKGVSYRGLIMNDVALNQYKRAQRNPHCTVRTKTFCSTTKDDGVATCFGSGSPTPGLNNVLMTFEFAQPCSTAIKLFEDGPRASQVSNFSDEQEILIFPGTDFKVKVVDDTSTPDITYIFLEHYNTDEEAAEAHQERFQSYIDSILLE